MNSETFQKWVQEQLIVGLKDYGPCMIVMDNAPYHNKLACQQPTSRWKKDQLIAWLQNNQITVPPNATRIERLAKNIRVR
ncbi:hypothetical protein C0J52_08305 [Blattella germanica]|nr:hypothetical protein C0J52_08305 [Blattella germanica]